jgi:transcriptional regulator EpsA
MTFASVEAQRDTRPDMDASAWLSSSQSQALVRLLEAAPAVRRRHQFFIWMQTHLNPLLPHVLAVCGAYQRHRREVVFESFHSVSLPEPMLASMAMADSPFTLGLARAWIEAGGQALSIGLEQGARGVALADVGVLRQAGLGHLVVHGVARPQRVHEIESLFVLAGTETVAAPSVLPRMELLIPLLHATYVRAQATERSLSVVPRQPQVAAATPAASITPRERQILVGVREGWTNQQIGSALGISALTVKNHVQKILRKLGAHNRAQAVAITIEEDWHRPPFTGQQP